MKHIWTSLNYDVFEETAKNVGFVQFKVYSQYLYFEIMWKCSGIGVEILGFFLVICTPIQFAYDKSLIKLGGSGTKYPAPV